MQTILTTAKVESVNRPMKRFSSLAFLLVAGLGLFSVGGVTAQVQSDTASVLLRVAEGLERDGRTRFADSIYSLILERYGISSAADRAQEALASLWEGVIARGGRTELIVHSTLFGGFLGATIPAALGADTPEAYGVGLLVGPAMGFMLSRAYSKANSVTPGQARAISFGGWWGAWQAEGWRAVLNTGGYSERGPFVAMSLGGIGGMVVGGMIGNSAEPKASTALLSNFGALWGTVFGLTGGYLLFDFQDKNLLASTLVAGDIGLLVMAASGSSLDWTTGRSWMVHLAGVAGAIGGLGLDMIIQPSTEKGAIAIFTLSSIAGLALGVVSTENQVIEDAEPMDASSMALIQVRNGRIAYGMPAPLPAVLTDETGARQLGFKLELFNAIF